MPFLNKKAAAASTGLIVKTRMSSEPPKEDSSAAIESCAMELIIAIHLKDVKAVSAALKDAFDVLESMPHSEDNCIEPHSYESQNIKAGEQE